MFQQQIWKKMSCKDQVAFCGKCRAKCNGGTQTTPQLPLLYLHSIIEHNTVTFYRTNNGTATEVIAPPKPKEEASTSTISSNSSNLQHATQHGQMDCQHCHIPPILYSQVTTLSFQSHKQQSTSNRPSNNWQWNQRECTGPHMGHGG